MQFYYQINHCYFFKYNLYIFCQSVHLGYLYVFIAGFFFLNKHNVTINEQKQGVSSHRVLRKKSRGTVI